MTFHQSVLSSRRRSSPNLPFLFMVVCALSLPVISCSLKSPEPTAKGSPPKLVGRIASIPADRRFALIESYGKWAAESGSILTTRGTDSRTANLLVTGETLGHFAAADIQSGTLEVGDAVYSHHVPKPPPAPPTPDAPPGPTPTSPSGDPPHVPAPDATQPPEPELPTPSVDS